MGLWRNVSLFKILFLCSDICWVCCFYVLLNRYFIEYLLHERTHISDFYSSLFKILKKQTGLIPVGLIKDDKSYVLSSILPQDIIKKKLTR